MPSCIGQASPAGDLEVQSLAQFFGGMAMLIWWLGEVGTLALLLGGGIVEPECPPPLCIGLASLAGGLPLT